MKLLSYKLLNIEKFDEILHKYVIQ